MTDTATDAITVVAVHGNGGGAFRFARVAPHLDGLLDFQPITLPGFGRSAKDDSLRTISDYADHLASVCRGFDRPVVLGHGIGGSITLDLVQRHADAVRGIILHAPVGAHLATRRIPQAMKLPFAKALAQWGISSRLFRPLWKKKFFEPGVPDEYLDQFFDEYRHCSVFADMFNIITPEWFEGLSPVALPSIIWWGAKERLLDAAQANEFQRALPASRVVIEAEWDHFPMVERPTEYATRLHDLVRQLG